MGLSLYIHVPFCRSRCTYCAFYSGEPLDRLANYPRRILAEANLRARGPWRGPVTTLYFGGGTPSLLGPSAVGRIVEAAARRWGLCPDAEVTLEANPGDDLDLTGYRAAGVTRLSVGVQSLEDETLARLGRRHGARDALHLVQAAVQAGFPCVSADLLFGMPNLDVAALTGAVARVCDAGARHVSLYSLEVHRGTPLARDRDAGLLSLLAPEEEDRQWACLDSALTDCGFTPYEVSNYCLPGAECRHNRAYWERGPYLGLGPGAHSFDPDAGSWGARSWNSTGLSPYEEALAAGQFPPGEGELLSQADFVLESLFLGLRRPEPLDFQDLSASVGAGFQRLACLLAAASEAGLLEPRPDRRPGIFSPTRAGMRTADGLAAALAGAMTAEKGNTEGPSRALTAPGAIATVRP